MSEQKGTIAVAEHFYSVQGEGQTIGRLSYFIRLAGCNLMCGGKGTEKDGELHNGATWRCDSIEVWMKGKAICFEDLIHEMGGPIFIARLRRGEHLIFTGGEPLLQRENIHDFLEYLELVYGIEPIVEIETNGTIQPGKELNKRVAFWNVSPKLSNSGEMSDRRWKPEVIKWFANQHPKVIFKFVIGGKPDLDEINATYVPLIHLQEQIFLMPAADNKEDLEAISEQVIDLCKRFGWHFSTRLHISIWNKKTGV